MERMEEAQLIERIQAAFAGVSRPEKESLTSCSCWECQEIRNDFAGSDPGELDPKRMRYHSWDMTFFTPAARQYFLPRWMVLGIQQPEMAYGDASLEALGSEAGWEVPGGYSIDQKQVILDFLRLVRHRNGDCWDGDLEAAWEKWSGPEDAEEVG
jgi:hypothetical protein